MLTRLIPNIFYTNLDHALDLFVDCLGFNVVHQDGEFAVVEGDGAKAYLVEEAEFAAKDRPKITIETDNINELYEEIHSKRPEMLHPNPNEVNEKPWGSQEFAVLDKTKVCVVFCQW